jgi:hypothetical protein
VQGYTQLTLFSLPESEHIAIARKLLGDNRAGGISSSDVRFAKNVRALDSSEKNLRAILERLMARKRIPPARSIKALRNLNAAITEAQSLPVERELYSLVKATGVKRVDAVLRYLGWDGRGGATLQEAGDESGITRERVRQIAGKVVSQLARKTYAPTLDRTLATLSESVVLADDAERRWRENGLTEVHFNAEGIIEAAKILKRNCRFKIRPLENHRFIVDESGDKLIASARRTVRRTCKRFTVMSLRDLQARVSPHGECPEADLALAVEGMSGFAWLDRSSGWFWIDEGYSRLLQRIFKILSVSTEVSLGELRSGVARDRRMAGFAPPVRVLANLCRSVPGVRVENELVIADPPLDSSKRLGKVERTFASILRQAGGLLAREVFERRCLERGMNRNTFNQYLSYSPIISKYGRGVFGIRGAAVEAGIVEHLRKRVPNQDVLRDYGYTTDGRIWLGYKLSTGTVASGVVTIPANMSRYIQGDFALKSESGEKLGRLRCQGQRAWSLKPVVQRRGLEAGDFLMLTFALDRREALIGYGPEELWDELVDPLVLVGAEEPAESPLEKVRAARPAAL